MARDPRPIDDELASWLLDPAFPTVRRLAISRLGLGGRPAPGPTADEAWIRALLQPQVKVPGGSEVHPYHKWRGIHWRLVTLAELDADPAEPEIADVVERGFTRVVAWLDGPSRLRASRAVDGRVRQCASQDGNAAWAATELGRAADPRVGALVERLLAWQWPDGGWNCDKRPGVAHSSFNESLAPLRALAAYARADPGSALGHDAASGAGAAAAFLLRHRVDRSHRTGALAHPALALRRWPAYWHYDRLEGLRALREAGRLGDARTTQALRDLAGDAGPDGTWRTDGRWWKRPGRTGTGVEAVDWTPEGEARMLTLFALEVLADR